MAKILVYNQDTNRMETYYRGENESMPYNTNGTLRVREFRGSSKSNDSLEHCLNTCLLFDKHRIHRNHRHLLLQKVP